MAEYSKLASGQTISTGAMTPVKLPFIPNYIQIENITRQVAGAGVTSASWMTDMGQGAAVVNVFGTGEQYIAPVGQASSGALVSGSGFTTIQAGLSLQYGPVVQHGATPVSDFSISKTNPAIVTTVGNHGLFTGQVIVFQNLYETAITGMQQISGIPFMVTYLTPTTFSISWDTTGLNYSLFNTATSLNNLGSYRLVLYPVLYAPGVSYISAVTFGTTTTVTTTAPNNYKIGQEIAFRIPLIWGPYQLNSLPDLVIPGSPIYSYVTSITNSTTFVCNINSIGYTAFNVNLPFLGIPGRTFPQVVAVGDVNTGGEFITATTPLYPSPRVFDGTTSSTSVGTPTINGAAILGAYINNTYQGFIIGPGISGTAADVIFWRAYLHDMNS